MKISKRVEQIGGDCHKSLCIVNSGQSLIFRTHGLDTEYLEMILVGAERELKAGAPASIDEALEVLSQVHLVTGEYIHQLIRPDADDLELKEDAEVYAVLC